MNFQQRLAGLAFAGALAATATGAFAAPAPLATMAPGTPGHPNMRGDCASAHNLAHVRRRLYGTITQLNHDQHDYGGHKATATEDLEAARTQIDQAVQYATSVDHDNPSCFTTTGGTGGYRQNPNMTTNNEERNQQQSNSNISRVRAHVEKMIDELQRDQRDYGGHREQAIDALQKARTELLAAEQDAKAHGY